MANPKRFQASDSCVWYQKSQCILGNLGITQDIINLARAIFCILQPACLMSANKRSILLSYSIGTLTVRLAMETRVISEMPRDHLPSRAGWFMNVPGRELFFQNKVNGPVTCSDSSCPSVLDRLPTPWGLPTSKPALSFFRPPSRFAPARVAQTSKPSPPLIIANFHSHDTYPMVSST